MSILTAENLGLSFGAFDLFRGITVTVPNDGKIGLIGPNGIGKTSLLLILAGINQPTTGQVHLARGRRSATCARRPWKPSPTATIPSTPRC